jgi:hypothetical protein
MGGRREAHRAAPAELRALNDQVKIAARLTTPGRRAGESKQSGS